MSEKRIITFRLDAGLADQLDVYARSHGWVGAQAGVRGGDHKGRDSGRSALLVCLIEALLEGRLEQHERAGSNPFPANERLPGESPDFPARIFTPSEPLPGADEDSTSGEK